MIRPGLYEKMERLDEVRSRANLGVIFIGIGIIIFFPSMAILESEWLCLFAVLIAGLGAFYLIGLKGKYKRLYKQIFVEDTLDANFENVFYVWNSGFTKQQIEDFKLFATGAQYKSEDYLRASYHGTDFEMAEVRIEKPDVYKELAVNGIYNDDQIVFKGRIIIFDFPGKILNPTRIYSRNIDYRNTEAILRSEKVEMESAAFNNVFQVYSGNPHDTYYLLTPHFMERLMVLNNKYKSTAICFENNKVIFAFNERAKDVFDGEMMREKISHPEEIAKIQREIDDIKYIIDTFK